MKYLTVIILVFLMSGCGGGGSDFVYFPAAATRTGVFVDSPAVGVSYQSGGVSGVTQFGGTFTYEVGKPVVFKVGDVFIGSIVPTKANQVITPLDLAKAKGLTGDAPGTPAYDTAIRIVQFLTSLNDFTNPGMLTISTTTTTNATGSHYQQLDLYSPATTDAAMQTIVTEIKPGATLTTYAAAAAHLNETLLTVDTVANAGEYAVVDASKQQAIYIQVYPDGTLVGSGISLVTPTQTIATTFLVRGTITTTSAANFNASALDPQTGVTIALLSGTSDGQGTITATITDNPPTTATTPVKFIRGDKGKNPYFGIYRGRLSADATQPSVGTLSFGIGLDGGLYGWAQFGASLYAMTGAMNTGTGIAAFSGKDSNGKLISFAGAFSSIGNRKIFGTWAVSGVTGTGTFTTDDINEPIVTAIK
jgi:hypothetical protein